VSTVVAVIPVYRPDQAMLTDLLASLADQHVPVIVVDDASPATFDRVLAAVDRAGITVLRHAQNAGIARSLNDGLSFALEHGASWLLTVDQDTALPATYVQDLLAGLTAAQAMLGKEAIGVIGAGIITDRSGNLRYPTRTEHQVTVTDEVIQTGSAWSVSAMQRVDGFNEALGIDAVDAAACLALRAAGFTVALAPEVRLDHRIGSARSVNLLGRQVMASGHAPARRESMVRNRLHLAPAEFRQSPKQGLRSLRRLAVNTLLAVSVEDHKMANARATIRGLFPRQKRS